MLILCSTEANYKFLWHMELLPMHMLRFHVSLEAVERCNRF